MPFKADDRCLSSPRRFRCHPKAGQPVRRKRRRRESWPRSSLPERFWQTRGRKAGRSGSRSAKEALACCIWVRDCATFHTAVRPNGVINTLTCVRSFSVQPATTRQRPPEPTHLTSSKWWAGTLTYFLSVGKVFSFFSLFFCYRKTIINQGA